MLSFSLFKLDNNISVYKSYDLIAYDFWFKLFNGFAVEVDYINQLFVGYAKTWYNKQTLRNVGYLNVKNKYLIGFVKIFIHCLISCYL